jgi:hypothetical protein
MFIAIAVIALVTTAAAGLVLRGQKRDWHNETDQWSDIEGW